jgi:hypothetical protein
VVRDDPHVRRIKRYVLARLRDELSTAPRGAQARLAKRLGVSGAHLSNMLSSTPSRQPGEDFRRKVAAHWGMTYAELEALAVGESVPPSRRSRTDPTLGPLPPNLALTLGAYVWLPELPEDVRPIVIEQARQYFVFSKFDLTPVQWQRVLTSLERAALAVRVPPNSSPASD